MYQSRVTDAEDAPGPSPAAVVFAQRVKQRFQVWLDKSTPHLTYRWVALGLMALLYAVRVYYLKGFYIVTYALGIFNLNLLLGFLSPQVDPELEGPTLPSKSDEEFRPFVRRLPEFKFWCAAFSQSSPKTRSVS
jgi:Rer1 family